MRWEGVLGQWQAIHVLHDQIGDAIAGGPAFQEPGDVGMFQPRQNLTLSAKSLDDTGAVGAIVRASLDDLDRDLFLILVVGAHGFIDESHATRGDAPQDTIGTEKVPRASLAGMRGNMARLQLERIGMPCRGRGPFGGQQ